ncbi:MAG: hypothetical protein HY951_00030, partial [Bacteroidia bacterium]|nr:hypothetical protein [Bacteroidia bacterium]
MKPRLIHIIFLFFALFLNLSLLAQKTVKSTDYAIEHSDTTIDFQTNPKGIYTVSVTSTNVTCYGLCDGTITVTLNGAPTFPVDLRLTLPADIGGTQNYNNLNAIDFPFTITNLCGSVLPYQVRVRDASNAIQWSPQVWVVAPGPITIDLSTQINETCPGRCDGSVKINSVINAAFPVDYLWSTTSILDSIGNLCAGTYIVTITDANSCSIDSTFTITAPPPLAPVASNTGPYCVGDLIQLNVDAYSSYVWSGPGGFNSILQNPTRAGATLAMGGLYSVTVTDATGCTGVATTTVVVNALPNATATNNGPVCEGKLLTLTGGINGMVSYSWSGPLGFSSNTQSPTVSASATVGMSGIYTITVTNVNGCTSTATTNVIVNAGPLATATSNSPVCIGQPLTLTGGPNGMTSYSWSGPLAYSNNTQSPTVSASATAGMAGTYTITVTNAGGCTSTATTTVVVNANPVATAASNSPVCIGQPLTLTGGPNGMTTYSWSGPLAYSNNTQSPTVSASATAGMAGIYTITVTNANGCTSTATTNVTINANPVATATSNSPVCVGKPLTLTGGPNG